MSGDKSEAKKKAKNFVDFLFKSWTKIIKGFNCVLTAVKLVNMIIVVS
jgi:hypothetical protein